MSNKLKSRDIILTDVRLLLTKTANSNKTKINLDDLTHLWNLIRESPDYYMLESTQRDRLHEIYKEINSILKYSFLTNEISDLSSMDVWNLWKKINTKASFQLKPIT